MVKQYTIADMISNKDFGKLLKLAAAYNKVFGKEKEVDTPFNEGYLMCTGICGSLEEMNFTGSIDGLIYDAAKEWEFFSGKPIFPVKHNKYNNPFTAYYEASKNDLMLQGEYGRRRVELLHRMIREAAKGSISRKFWSTIVLKFLNNHERLATKPV